MLKSASWQSDLPRGTQSRNNLSHDGTQRIPVLAMKSMWPGNWTKGVSILSCRCIEVCDDGKTVARKLNCLSSPATFSYILTWNNGCAYWNSPAWFGWVSFNGQPATLPEYEIETLRKGLDLQIYAEPHPYLHVGRRVRVLHGPMAVRKAF